MFVSTWFDVLNSRLSPAPTRRVLIPSTEFLTPFPPDRKFFSRTRFANRHRPQMNFVRVAIVLRIKTQGLVRRNVRELEIV